MQLSSLVQKRFVREQRKLTFVVPMFCKDKCARLRVAICYESCYNHRLDISYCGCTVGTHARFQNKKARSFLCHEFCSPRWRHFQNIGASEYWVGTMTVCACSALPTRLQRSPLSSLTCLSLRTVAYHGLRKEKLCSHFSPCPLVRACFAH